jgi:HD-like signal output (HDOD) protein
LEPVLVPSPGQPPPKARLADVIARTVELPAMPMVAQRVMLAVQNPNVSASQLAAIITQDQGLTGKLLAVCNSAFYGLSRHVESVQQAVTVLGFRELLNLVVSTSARYLFRSFGPQEKLLWEHGLGCALASVLVAQSHAPKTKDVAFLAGQMHDVGKVVMSSHDPKGFSTTLKDPVLHLLSEQQVFGFTHADVGSLLMTRWNMPPAVEHAAFHHHDLSLVQSLAPESAPLVACVALGNHLCHRTGVGVEELTDLDLPLEVVDATDILGLHPEDVEKLVTRFAKQWADAKAHLV